MPTPVPQSTEVLLHPKKAAAAILGISVRSLDYLIANKELPARRVGGRVLIATAALRKFASMDHLEPIRPSA